MVKHTMRRAVWQNVYQSGVLDLKAHQMFSVRTKPEKVENATITGHFVFEFEGNRTIIVTSSFFVFKKIQIRCFQKLRFRDGLVWTVGLTVEIKPQFPISSS